MSSTCTCKTLSGDRCSRKREAGSTRCWQHRVGCPKPKTVVKKAAITKGKPVVKKAPIKKSTNRTYEIQLSRRAVVDELTDRFDNLISAGDDVIDYLFDMCAGIAIFITSKGRTAKNMKNQVEILFMSDWAYTINKEDVPKPFNAAKYIHNVNLVFLKEMFDLSSNVARDQRKSTNIEMVDINRVIRFDSIIKHIFDTVM